MHDISLRQQSDVGIRQQQKLLMTMAMRQALYVMQLPILELSEWVKLQIENNPALEITLPECEPIARQPLFHKTARLPPRESLENLIAAPLSLFDHLMARARCHCNCNDLSLAQWIIGHF